MWKPSSFLPQGVSVYTRYDTQAISGTLTNLNFFPANPVSSRDADSNYTSNPFPGPDNVVLLGLALQCTMHVIRDDTVNSINAVQVVNQLFDSVIRLDSNAGRVQKILIPTPNYMNFANTQGNVALIANTAPAYVAVSQLTLQSTGPRQLQNLFYLNKSEAFKLYLEFPGANGVTFPTTANWTASAQGRFEIKCSLFCADMTDDQVKEYNQKLIAASLAR